jgi:glutathione S-transferase
MMLLHQIPSSGNCYKVRLAAHQLGIDLRLKDYPSQQYGGTRTPEFLAINPNGKVPVLEFEDGYRLPESGAILFHLGEGTALQPADSRGRAEMLSWMFFEQYSHEPCIAVALYLKLYARPEERAAWQSRLPELIAKGNNALWVMEQRLCGRDWLAGSAYSLADIALFAYTHRAETGGFALSAFPRVSAWVARVQTTPRFLQFTET